MSEDIAPEKIAPAPFVSAPEETPKEIEVEIHKPKPVHSWREFLTELGTITLGICIALAGEQTLEWLHWRNQVREARAVIATEMTYNLVGAIARMRAIGCGEQRLDALSKILDEAARTGNLPAVGDIGGPPRHQWHSGAWESVVASQTATRFRPEQLAALASLYKSVQRADLNGTSETDAWSDLYAIVGPGRRLDPASETQLRQALSRARNMGRIMATVSLFVVIQAAAMDLPFSPAERQELARIKKRPLTEAPRQADDANTSAICGPIGTAPPNYGEAAESRTAALLSKGTMPLPDFSEGPP